MPMVITDAIGPACRQHTLAGAGFERKAFRRLVMISAASEDVAEKYEMPCMNFVSSAPTHDDASFLTLYIAAAIIPLGKIMPNMAD